MSEAKWEAWQEGGTGGPWYIEIKGEGHIYAGDEKTARLIAAAPELLQEAKNQLQGLEDGCACLESSGCTNAAKRAELRRLIAKATVF